MEARAAQYPTPAPDLKAPRQPSEGAAEIEATKGELAAVQAMKNELASAAAASDFERVQVLAKRLQVKDLQQQLSAAVASENFPEVARLGKELDACTSAESQPLARPEPAPEPEPEPPAEARARRKFFRAGLNHSSGLYLYLWAHCRCYRRE